MSASTSSAEGSTSQRSAKFSTNARATPAPPCRPAAGAHPRLVCLGAQRHADSLIEFLEGKSLHTPEELLTSKSPSSPKTSMVDVAKEVYEAAQGRARSRPRAQRVMSKMSALQEEVAPILELVTSAARVAELGRALLQPGLPAAEPEHFAAAH